MNAAHLEGATGFERIQLAAMAKIIEAKVEELAALRRERHALALRISARRMAKNRRLKLLGAEPAIRRVA